MIDELSILDLLGTWLGLALTGLGIYLLVTAPVPNREHGTPAAGLGGACFIVGLIWLILFFTLLR
jgi:hypothetical protein